MTKLKPRPIRLTREVPVEKVDDHSYWDCAMYSGCLQMAAEERWKAWSCRWCNINPNRAPGRPPKQSTPKRRRRPGIKPNRKVSKPTGLAGPGTKCKQCERPVPKGHPIFECSFCRHVFCIECGLGHECDVGERHTLQ